MRITGRCLAAAILIISSLSIAPESLAQDSEVMMPAQSSAKAKEILQQAIQALGGDAYLNVHDLTCTGRLSQFGHSGELNGFEHFIDYTIPTLPIKDRLENLPKRNIIEVKNGNKGWDTRSRRRH